ncbi:hypothetical protein MKEN_01064500 [Mycena kentingensis (nom. inval.)]|nr:hypothetical protein MKEN_01064500 [Mycena kentingensis (nom. inval.)]
MRPSPTLLARKLTKPLSSKLQVFRDIPTTPAPAPLSKSKTQLPFVLARKTTDPELIISAPEPRQPDAKPPTLLRLLMDAQNDAAPGQWPPNLRIEPVVTRADWEPVKKGVRSKLKRLLKEA